MSDNLDGMQVRAKIAFLMRSSILWILLLVTLTGCTQYEYQEDLYLEVDGSGEVWVSCSEDLFTLLYETDYDLDISDLEEFYESPDLQVISVERSRREGREFLHVGARFEDLNRLSHHKIFEGRRRYRFEAGEELIDLRVDILDRRRPDDVPERLRDGSFRFRVHFPSPVRYHNSETGIERGNVVTWEQSVADHLEGEPLRVEARFEKKTVLAMTLTLLAIALSVVLLVVSTSLFILVRIGRRELAAQANPPSNHTS